MGLILLVLVAVGLCAWWASQPWRVAWRRARVRARAFPAPWRTILRRNVPQVARLPTDMQLRLKRQMQVFLAEKQFIGCAGQTITDEVRVTIAALACMPLLGRSRGYYPRLHSVLVYPGPFMVDRVRQQGPLQMHQRQVLSGESWGEGQVVLSWEHVQREAAEPEGGHSVVVHEFAHQLDQDKGYANGAPLLGDRGRQARWARVMQDSFALLRARLDSGEPDPLGEYASTEPAEFFAVASERFFCQPGALAQSHPAVYAELSRFYEVDPLVWT
ncbi:zinc-dependent peptidase [Roseateles sp. SL47]|uniref:M90 family metallopeptidase n=1 Tax=Roseateles sp. SL47 TaxID=2995138 RepID=UPI00226ED175|nr:M90 family metallopeptidase [Roseateles sp. SL47]WAC73324.1 zinc-dependent peptidase [Roseateles sp. SL47]